MDSFNLYLDKILNDINSDTFDRTKANVYSADIINEIMEEYNLFGAEGIPKKPTKDIIDKISLVFDVLLDKGLDVNYNGDENPLSDCIWIENIEISLMLLKKFLARGGDPNYVLSCEGESLFDYMDFAVGYDMFGDEQFMKIWLLLIDYGGCNRDGSNRLIRNPGKSYDITENIDNIGLRIEYKEDGYHMMHFYDQRDGQEFAMYEKLYKGG